MNFDNLAKWLAGLVLLGVWAALVFTGYADRPAALTLITFIQASLVSLGAHGLTVSGTKAGQPALPTEPSPATPPSPAVTLPNGDPRPPLYVRGQGGFYHPLLGLILSVCVIAVLLLCGGCATTPSPTTPLGKFTLADAQGASALAKANGDTAGQKCYDYIVAQIEAAGNVPFTPGLLYLNELKRTAANSANGLAAACGGVLPLTIGL